MLQKITSWRFPWKIGAEHVRTPGNAKPAKLPHAGRLAFWRAVRPEVASLASWRFLGFQHFIPHAQAAPVTTRFLAPWRPGALAI